MELSNISGEQLKAALELLVEEQSISEDIVKEAIKRCPTPELKRCTDVVHGLLCKLDHDTECMYYSEEQKDQAWTRADHQEWLGRTQQIMAEAKLSNEKALRNAIAQVNGVVQRLGTVPGGLEMLGIITEAISLKELAAGAQST